MITVKQRQYYRAKSRALENLRAHGLETLGQLPDMHLFAVSKLLTELDGVVADVECTDAKIKGI